MYLLKLALRPWRSAPFSQIFSSLAMSLLLFLMGFLFWLDRGMKPVVARLETEQVITAYLDPSIDLKEEKQVVDSIRVVLGAQAADVRTVGAMEFVGDLKGHYPELARELEDLGGEVKTIVPRYVSVAGMFAPSALDKVKAVTGVESAESSRDRYQHIVGAFRAIRWVARLMVAGLWIALFTGLIHLTRMNAYLHEETINLLRLWGAGGFQARVPGVFSALLIGVLGGAITFAGWVLAGGWLGKQVLSLSPMLKGMPMPSLSLGLLLFAAAIVIGVMAGLLCGPGSSSSHARG